MYSVKVSSFITFQFNGNDTFLVNHVVALVRGGLASVMKYIVLLLAVISLADLYMRRERFFKDGANIFLSGAKIIGFIMLAMVVFNIGPGFLLADDVGPAVLFKILIPITIVVTIVQARIWPTCTKPDRCMEGCTPNLEKEYRSDLLRNAYNEGITVAQHQDSFVSRERLIIKESILIVAAFATGVNFFAIVGILINQYTPLIQLKNPRLAFSRVYPNVATLGIMNLLF